MRFPGSIAVARRGSRRDGGAAWSAAGRGPRAVGSVAIVALTLVNAIGLQPGKWTQNSLSATKLAAFAGCSRSGAGRATPRRAGSSPFFVPATARRHRHGAHPGALRLQRVERGDLRLGGDARSRRGPGPRAGPRHVGMHRALPRRQRRLPARHAAWRRSRQRRSRPARRPTSSAGTSAGPTLSPLIAVCVLSSIQATMLVGPRIYHAMASDRLFFAPLGRLDPRTHVPLVALLAQGIISVVLLLSGRFDQLVRFTMFAIVAFSTLTVAASSFFASGGRRRSAPSACPATPGCPLSSSW